MSSHPPSPWSAPPPPPPPPPPPGASASSPDHDDRSLGLSILGSLVGGALCATWLILDTWPTEPSELGAYHDPHAADVPMAGLVGWMGGVVVGCMVALAIAKRTRVLRTGGILAALTAAVFLPAAFVVALLSAFGGVVIVIPPLIVWGIVAPVTARPLALGGSRPPSPHSV